MASGQNRRAQRMSPDRELHWSVNGDWEPLENERYFADITSNVTNSFAKVLKEKLHRLIHRAKGLHGDWEECVLRMPWRFLRHFLTAASSATSPRPRTIIIYTEFEGHMVSVERKSVTGVWGRAPSGVHGQSPWSQGSLKLNAFCIITISGVNQFVIKCFIAKQKNSPDVWGPWLPGPGSASNYKVVFQSSIIWRVLRRANPLIIFDRS